MRPTCRGPLVVAGLFEPERVHSPHESGVRMFGIEARQRAADAIAEIPRVADEEVEEVTHQQREHVGRPADEQFVEDPSRIVPPPFRPCGHRRRMGGLAVVERQRRELRRRVTRRPGRPGRRSSSTSGTP